MIDKRNICDNCTIHIDDINIQSSCGLQKGLDICRLCYIKLYTIDYSKTYFPKKHRLEKGIKLYDDSKIKCKKK